MREFAGKTAFVTGGAAGIGLALGRAFAQSGMKVMLADIETDALQAAVKSLQEISPDIRGTICDVADAESVERAAQAAFDAFGRVHVVCNNAGVAAGGGIDHISLDNWRWVIDVNLMGVLHGIKSFLPHIRAHGEGGHIVNTASMAGMQGGLGFSPYAASKFAVVSMSEGLSLQLKPFGIGVSVLCPSFVRTRIGESGRNRPERYGQSQPLDPASPAAAMVAEIARQMEAGLDPATVAERVLAAIRQDELYIFTHPGMRAEVEPRFAAILAAMDEVSAPIILLTQDLMHCSQGQNDARHAPADRRISEASRHVDMDGLKRQAAAQALAHVQDGMKLGLGTGSTAKHFVDLLGEKVAGGLKVVGVPTSEATRAQAEACKIPLTTLDAIDRLDLTVDGADELDRALNLIKGGGGALLREKIVAAASDRMIVIADDTKWVDVLGRFPLPVEVIPFGLAATQRAMATAFAQSGVSGQMGLRKGKDGHVFVTDGGHWIVDAHLGRITDAPRLAGLLSLIPGVVEHGLFIGLASIAILAGAQGIRVVERR